MWLTLRYHILRALLLPTYLSISVYLFQQETRLQQWLIYIMGILIFQRFPEFSLCHLIKNNSMFLDFGRYGHTSELNWGFFFSPKKIPNHFFSFILKFEQLLQKFSFEKQLSGEWKFPLFTLLLLLAGNWNDMKQTESRRKPNLLHIHVSMKNSKDRKARWGIYVLDSGGGGKGLGLQEEVK